MSQVIVYLVGDSTSVVLDVEHDGVHLGRGDEFNQLLHPLGPCRRPRDVDALYFHARPDEVSCLVGLSDNFRVGNGECGKRVRVSLNAVLFDRIYTDRKGVFCLRYG